MLIKRVSYINSDTGEVVNARNDYYNNTYRKKKGYMYMRNKVGFKVFRDEIRYPSQLSAIERGRYLDLCSMSIGNSQKLMYKSNGKIKPMRLEYICKVLEIGRTTGSQLINKYIKLGMLKKDEEGVLVINPIYGLKVKYIDSQLYDMFREDLSKRLNEWVKIELERSGEENEL